MEFEASSSYLGTWNRNEVGEKINTAFVSSLYLAAIFSVRLYPLLSVVACVMAFAFGSSLSLSYTHTHTHIAGGAWGLLGPARTVFILSLTRVQCRNITYCAMCQCVLNSCTAKSPACFCLLYHIVSRANAWRQPARQGNCDDYSPSIGIYAVSFRALCFVWSTNERQSSHTLTLLQGPRISCNHNTFNCANCDFSPWMMVVILMLVMINCPETLLTHLRF
jgi:hypothetical protein